MFKAFIVDRKTKAGVFLTPYPADILEYKSDPNNLLWIDFYQPQYEWIKKTFELTNHIIELCKDKTSVPYYDASRESFFIRMMILNTKNPLSTGECAFLNCIVTTRYILTLHESRVDAFNDIDADPDCLAKMLARGTDYFLSHLSKLIVSEHMRFAEKIQSEAELLEYRIFHAYDFQTKEKLFDLRKMLADKTCCLEEQKNLFEYLWQNHHPLVKTASSTNFKQISYSANTLVCTFEIMEKNAAALTEFASIRVNRKIASYIHLLLVILIVTGIALSTMFFTYLFHGNKFVSLILYLSIILLSILICGLHLKKNPVTK